MKNKLIYNSISKIYHLIICYQLKTTRFSKYCYFYAVQVISGMSVYLNHNLDFLSKQKFYIRNKLKLIDIITCLIIGKALIGKIYYYDWLYLINSTSLIAIKQFFSLEYWNDMYLCQYSILKIYFEEFLYSSSLSLFLSTIYF